MDKQLSNVMDTLQTQDGQVMADSRDVAKFFGKRHDHVLEAIRNLGCNEEFSAPNFRGTSYIDSCNREKSAYLMTRDGFTLLAMGFTGKEAMKFKIAYIQAFNDMEAKLRELTTPTTFLESLKLAVKLEEEKQALALELKDEKAKTSLLEKSDDNVEVREAAKLLNMKPTELFTWLEENKWFYKPKSNSKHKVAYQAKINRGYLEQCTTFINDAFEVSFIKITPKGLSYLASKFSKEVK